MIEPDEDFRSPTNILIDNEPDERGNLAIAAKFLGDTTIALHFNVN